VRSSDAAERANSSRSASQPVFAFGDFELDEARLEIDTGDRDAARHRLTRILGVHRRDSHCLYEMAALEMLEGNHTRAATLCQQILDIEERGEGTREMPARRLLAVCLMRSGDAEAAEDQLRALEADNREGIEQGDERWCRYWELAVVAALRGRPDEALDCYERACDTGRRDFRWDGIEPAFDSLRDEPRFRVQLERMRASVEEMRERAVREGWHRFDSI
jgi:tetratricopeptide (TPR) repeat protein